MHAIYCKAILLAKVESVREEVFDRPIKSTERKHMYSAAFAADFSGLFVCMLVSAKASFLTIQ